MKTKNALIVGCGVLALVAFAAVVGIVVFVSHASKNPKHVVVTVNGPTDVVVGQTFDLEVILKNERAGQAFEASDVDIAEAYLAGFTISSVKPTPKSNTHVPIDNSRSYTFDVSIPPGASQSFTFTLRAEKAGIFRGDVDVCEGVQFITGMAQTVVKKKE